MKLRDVISKILTEFYPEDYDKFKDFDVKSGVDALKKSVKPYLTKAKESTKEFGKELEKAMFPVSSVARRSKDAQIEFWKEREAAANLRELDRQQKDLEDSLASVRNELKTQQQLDDTYKRQDEVRDALERIRQGKPKLQRTVDTIKDYGDKAVETAKDYGNRAVETAKDYGSKVADFVKEHPYHAAGVTAAAIAAGLGAKALAKKLRKK